MTLAFRDRVRLADDHDSALGNPGKIYEYLGPGAAGVDLSTQEPRGPSTEISSLDPGGTSVRRRFWSLKALLPQLAAAIRR